MIQRKHGPSPVSSVLPVSRAPILHGKPNEQETHRYLYWENGTMSPHAQSVRLDQWWAHRDHPSKPIKLYDLTEDLACKNDLAKTNPEVIDSEWYVNPGESKEQTSAKRDQATSMKSMQHLTRANTAYKGRTEPSPVGDILKTALEE